MNESRYKLIQRDKHKASQVKARMRQREEVCIPDFVFEDQ
jgi:hypothetical protein